MADNNRRQGGGHVGENQELTLLRLGANFKEAK